MKKLNQNFLNWIEKHKYELQELKRVIEENQLKPFNKTQHEKINQK